MEISVSEPAPDFGPAELFGVWGDSDVVRVQGRLISIRLVTARDSENPDLLFDRIAIYDVTNVSDVFGTTFDLEGNGPVLSGAPFPLDTRRYGDDRTAALYVLKIIPQRDDRIVQLSAPNGSIASNLPGSEVTLRRLREWRRSRAVGLGRVSEIDGRSYYVLPQSAGRGCWQFLDRRSLEPAYFGCVNKSVGGQIRLLDSVLASNEYIGRRRMPDGADHRYYLGYVIPEYGGGVPRVRVMIRGGEGARLEETTEASTSPSSRLDIAPGAKTRLRRQREQIRRPDENRGPGKLPDSGSRRNGPQRSSRPDGWPDLSVDGYLPDPALNAGLSSGLRAKICLYAHASSGTILPGTKWLLVTRDAAGRGWSHAALPWLGRNVREMGRSPRLDLFRGHIAATSDKRGTVYTDLASSVDKRGRIRWKFAGVFDKLATRNNLERVADVAVLALILRTRGLGLTRWERAAVLKLAMDLVRGSVKRGRFGKNPAGADDPPRDIAKPATISFVGTVQAGRKGPDGALLYAVLDGSLECRLYPKPSCSVAPASAHVPTAGTRPGPPKSEKKARASAPKRRRGKRR